jgi:hypothetical protein
MSVMTPRSYSAAYTPDRLFAGITQMVSWDYTLLAGRAFKRGELLGKITASGKLTISTAAATDGSQAPFAICMDDYDATTADVNGGVYVKGEFNQLAVIYGTGQTAAGVSDALRDLGIYLKPAVPA